MIKVQSSYNDPYLNRFLQPDTIIPSMYNPQSLNRYSYVNNSPIGNADPSGHCIWDLCILEGVGIIEISSLALAAGAGALAIANNVLPGRDERIKAIASAIDQALQMPKHGTPRQEKLQDSNNVPVNGDKWKDPINPCVNKGWWCYAGAGVGILIIGGENCSSPIHRR